MVALEVKVSCESSPEPPSRVPPEYHPLKIYPVRKETEGSCTCDPDHAPDLGPQAAYNVKLLAP